MRDYGKVSPKFWIGSTGKALRKAGAEAQVVAMYLMTSPHSNMLGMFYMPSTYIAHETGLTIEGASKGLARAIEAGFCVYDEASEVVWVMEMARFQIGEELVESDRRCKGVQNEYDAVPANPFLAPFFDRYCKAFNLTSKRVSSAPVGSPLQAPSKPLASQEQEQEQEQEQGASVQAPPPAAPLPVPTKSTKAAKTAVQIPGVPDQLLADYLVVRKAKKAGALTATALAQIQREADKAGLTLAEALTACCGYSWVGFQADWYAERTAGRKPGAAPNARQAENERRSAGFLRLIGAAPVDANTIDMEPTHATR